MPIENGLFGHVRAIMYVIFPENSSSFVDSSESHLTSRAK